MLYINSLILHILRILTVILIIILFMACRKWNHTLRTWGYDYPCNANSYLLHKNISFYSPVSIQHAFLLNVVQMLSSHFKLRVLSAIPSFFLSEKCALENPWTLLPIVSRFIGKIFSEHASLLKWTDTGDWLLCPYLDGYWMPYQFNYKLILLFWRIWCLYIAGSPESCMGRKWLP